MPGTKVFLPNSASVPIEEVKIGDEVLTLGRSAVKVVADDQSFQDKE